MKIPVGTVRAKIDVGFLKGACVDRRVISSKLEEEEKRGTGYFERAGPTLSLQPNDQENSKSTVRDGGCLEKHGQA